MSSNKNSGDSAAKLNRAQSGQTATGNGAEINEKEKSEEIPLIENPLAPPTLSDVALHGVIGELVNTIERHTEAHPAALLFQLLAAVGNMLGRAAGTLGGNSRHWANFFVAIVGRTSKARKGTSWSACEPVLRVIDPDWVEAHVIEQDLSTGEGLVYAVRDPVDEDDAGVEDKRKLIIAEELANVFSAQSKGKLSATIRKVWDGKTIGNLTRTKPLIATNPHISIVAHSTASELRDRLVGTREMTNGWANRFLWILVDRARSLPFGADTGELPIKKKARQIRKALDTAKDRPQLVWDPEDGTRDRWKEVYEDLMHVGAGPVASVTDRAEAQILRIAFLFAVLDRSATIRLPHLEAALACWDYARQSAAKLFGGVKALSPRAKKLLTALQAEPKGLIKSQINRLFSNHLGQVGMRELIGELINAQLAVVLPERCAGRTRERVKALSPTSAW